MTRNQIYYAANREKEKARTREYSAKNKDKRDLYNKEYYAKDPEYHRARSSKYVKEHLDERVEYNRKRIAAMPLERRAALQEATKVRATEWNRRNKSRRAEISKKSAAKMPADIRKAKHREYYANNKEKFQLKAKRDAAKRKDKIKKAKEIYRKTPEGIAAARTWRSARKARNLALEKHHTGKDILALYVAQLGLCANPLCAIELNGKYHADHINPLCRGGTNDAENIQLLCPLCNMRKHKKTMEEFLACFKKFYKDQNS